MRDNYVLKALFLCMFIFPLLSFSQEIAGFENLPLGEKGYWNGAEGAGSVPGSTTTYFTTANASFTNVYTITDFGGMTFGSWAAFSYSSITDNTTTGYENQYSAITGKGVNQSEKYGVFYQSMIPDENRIVLTDATQLSGLYLTNSTYAAWSMREGDGFAKKFGGTTGNDPDWFKLTITGLDSEENTIGTINFYLADYRFPDNKDDYIIDEWTWLDLSALGEVKMLQFALSSSDTNFFGMKTPAYFCLDNLNGTPPEQFSPLTLQVSDDMTVKIGDEANIFAAIKGGKPPYSYAWSPTDFLDKPQSDMPLITPENDITYTVSVTDANSNTQSGEVHITVVDDQPPQVAAPPEPVYVDLNTNTSTAGSFTQDISLVGIFTDPDDDDQAITVEITNNTNSAIVSAEIDEEFLVITYTDSKFGEATITLTATSNGKTVDTDIEITIRDITGIENNAPQTVSVYPNPVNNILYIDMNRRIKRISVFDMTGNRLVEIENPDNYQINMQPFNKGVYLILIETDKNRITKTVIKQ